LQQLDINRKPIVAGAAFAMLAVLIGAFAAHGLKQVLDVYALGLIEIAARYQMYHAIALLIVGVMSMARQLSARWLTLAAAAFVIGIVLFSGSLYLLAFSGIGWLGAITPVGGVAFVVGWCALIAAAIRPSGEVVR
jgi:uncharacterized membrane protein YgdD (TMEM256/DUF423 family)